MSWRVSKVFCVQASVRRPSYSTFSCSEVAVVLVVAPTSGAADLKIAVAVSLGIVHFATSNSDPWASCLYHHRRVRPPDSRGVHICLLFRSTLRSKPPAYKPPRAYGSNVRKGQPQGADASPSGWTEESEAPTTSNLITMMRHKHGLLAPEHDRATCAGGERCSARQPSST
jgi:hypothetical protein